MEHSDKIDQIGAALLKVQSAVTGVEATSENPAFRSKYADLSAINEATRLPLTEAGIVCTQWPGEFNTEKKTMDMTTMLLHAASGQWFKGTIIIPLSKADAQGYGSACTYARRYGLSAALGLSVDDDDGNEAVKKPKQELGSKQDALEKPASKADSRDVYERLSAANKKLASRADFDAFWAKDSVRAAANSLPADWKKNLAQERDDKAAEIAEREAIANESDPFGFDKMEKEMSE